MTDHVSPDELPEFTATIRGDLEELWAPDTCLERHEVENIAQAMTRQRLLDRLERRVLQDAAEEPDPALDGGEGGEGEARASRRRDLPSLDSLVRYRRRLTKEVEEAERRLQGHKRFRALVLDAEVEAGPEPTGRRHDDDATNRSARAHSSSAGGSVRASEERAIDLMLHAEPAATAPNARPALNRAERRRRKALSRKISV